MDKIKALPMTPLPQGKVSFAVLNSHGRGQDKLHLVLADVSGWETYWLQ